MHILYFVTAHGYGHGVRTGAICNAFSSDVHLTIISDLPADFFSEEICRPFSLRKAAFDCGCFQSDSISVDIDGTLREYARIADVNKTVLASEALWCRSVGATGIVSDITPFAFEIARHASLPSAAVTNFTWHDIYSEYCASSPAFEPYLKHMADQYAMADALFALEPPNAMHCFGAPRVSVPVVGRRGRIVREELCRKYAISSASRIGLIYVGNFGMHTADWKKLERFGDWEFLGVYPLPGSPANFHLVEKSDFRYQDLSASVDLMISKIGYGTFSECVLHGTPLLYLPRENFAEYPVLERAVIEWGGGYRMDKKHFYALAWDDALAHAAQCVRPDPVGFDGAAFCARKIELLFKGGPGFRSIKR